MQEKKNMAANHSLCLMEIEQPVSHLVKINDDRGAYIAWEPIKVIREKRIVSHHFQAFVRREQESFDE